MEMKDNQNNEKLIGGAVVSAMSPLMRRGQDSNLTI